MVYNNHSLEVLYMNILFIDSHSKDLVIAIKKGSKLIKESTRSDKSHSEVAMPTLEKVFKEADLEPKDISEIIVVNGPGSFTGVRIGVTIAKTLAFTLHIPIKTITSLEALGISDKNVFDLITMPDTKGMYSAYFDGKNFTTLEYRKNKEFDDFIKNNDYKISNNEKLDIDRIIEYMKDKETTNPHSVNPIYVKKIDAEK